MGLYLLWPYKVFHKIPNLADLVSTDRIIV